MHSFVQDLRFGVRMLLRAPGFTALVVAILALGVGANSAVFSVVNAVLLRPLPYHDPDSLYQLDEVNPKGQPSGVSPLDLDAFVQHSNALDQGAVSHWYNGTITGSEGAENLFGVRISRDLFPMLGVQPSAGRTFRPEEFQPGAAPAVMLSDRLWQRRYHRSPAIVGQTLMLNGQGYTVIGVMPADFYFPQRFEFWLPAQLTAEEAGKRDARWSCLVRLKSGSTPAQSRTALDAVYRNTAAADLRLGWHLRLTPIHEQVTGRSRPALLITLGAVAFVLLIACSNIANLLLARGSARTREIAVRAALGAGRARVFRQLLTESILISALGGAAGLLIGYAGSKLLVHQFPERLAMPRLDQTHMDTGVLLFTAAVSVLTGIVFGLIPAWNAARTDINEALKQGGRGSGPRSHTLRNSLVVAETALSLVLLTGAGLMLRSFARLLAVDPGFNPEHVLTLRVPLPTAITQDPQKAPHYTRLIEQVQSLPGLAAVGLISPLPLSNVDANATFAVEGRPAPTGDVQLVKLRVASPGYFRAMGLRVAQGRAFEDSDGAGAPPVALVNQALVRRYFPNENPIGKHVSMSAKGPWLSIIGIVHDIKSLNLADKSEPELYRDYRQFFFAPFAQSLVVRTQSADPAALAAALERQIRATDPDQPVVDVRAMPQLVSDSVAQPRFYSLLLAVFAVIALLLAAAGLYGVLSYSVTQRIREIGIRLALGASKTQIIYDIAGKAMTLVFLGLAIGLAGAAGLTRLLQSQLYEIKPTDPLTFAAVSLLLALTGFAAAWLPARRATRIDPTTALRAE
jgi:putative ABC transport system permease protein